MILVLGTDQGRGLRALRLSGSRCRGACFRATGTKIRTWVATCSLKETLDSS